MLAVALDIGACQAGFSIYFTTLDYMVRRLRTAEATGRSEAPQQPGPRSRVAARSKPTARAIDWAVDWAVDALRHDDTTVSAIARHPDPPTTARPC